jgi:hypothetical protein
VLQSWLFAVSTLQRTIIFPYISAAAAAAVPQQVCGELWA